MTTKGGDQSPAAQKLIGLLGYVEQVMRMDERVALRLAEHRLPNEQTLTLHQHELTALPCIRHDVIHDDGPVWLSVERPRRTAPPPLPEDIAAWLEISPDPGRAPELREALVQTVDACRKDEFIAAGVARADRCEPAILPEARLAGMWDVHLAIDDDPLARSSAETYVAEQWLPWAIAERATVRAAEIYQRLFEFAQLMETSSGGPAVELVWGVGLSRIVKDGREVDLPLVERLVDIEIDDAAGAAIQIRPRQAPPKIDLRPYEDIGLGDVRFAEDAARRALDQSEPEESSPFRRESFEPALRACQARLDPEGVYLPDRTKLADDASPPEAGSRLVVTDRWVLYGRRRSNSFILADLESLKASVEAADKAGTLPGPAETLVMGPSSGASNDWKPLTDRIGEASASDNEPADDAEASDLFFPKAFNDDQIAIVRRLEKADGLVVQGPPGTGKTHTIANIICHYMATGRRILVVSHGEMALGVLRDQLPDEVRELAISVTATEREGFRQLESAVRLLQSVLQDLVPSDMKRTIDASERTIVGLRQRLSDIDAEIGRRAALQLSPGALGERPDELAQRLVAARERHAWFDDRPAKASAELALEDDLTILAVARRRLGNLIVHRLEELPSAFDLPDGEVIARIHEDLRLARHFGDAAKRDEAWQTRLTSPDDAALAVRGAEAAASLLAVRQQTSSRAWLEGTAARAFEGTVDGVDALLATFAHDASAVFAGRQAFVARPVAVPPEYEAVVAEAGRLVEKLAQGEAPFGPLKFRARSLKPILEAIRVTGAPASSGDDWAHVRAFLAYRENVASLKTRWRALAEECGAPPIETDRELIEVVETLGLVLIDGRIAMQTFREGHGRLFTLAPSLRETWARHEHLTAVEAALRNAAAAARLVDARKEADRVDSLFTERSGKLGGFAKEVLARLGNEAVGEEQISRVWTTLRRQIDDVVQARDQFSVLRDVTARIEAAGAPLWADRLRSVPALDDRDEVLTSDWASAWDWAAALAYLEGMEDRAELQALAEERIVVDADLRKAFSRLVKDRTFYALGAATSGPVRAALTMVATALRRAGKSTSATAARHRRDARLAMAQCYGAVPCWIMPAWRVSEQLPPDLGAFDLVIMDEASQSDIRDLPALLRGKKILVVGDDRQVSPSAAFIENSKIERLERGYLQEQPFRTLLLPGASLYDLARVMFPDKLVMLKEHFRSVEPIIRFSMQFYPEPLLPLRIPSGAERLDPPLVDIYVADGRREGDKQNPREAEVIVGEIERFIDDPQLARIEEQDRWRSIGVISLIGAKQAALVNKMLMERIGEDVMRRHRILCGDSAMLQGDERDVVFLSMIADARRKQSQTTMQFEQRFNVAMSRARDRLVLVRSVREEDLKPEDLKAKIIRHFHDPMAGVPARSGTLEELCESGFERNVYRRLVDAGYHVTPQVGSAGYRIDLVVEGTAGRRLAIECDGDLYHGPERWVDDMRRQRVLERVGWRFWRCWASSFTLDPDACMADLVATLGRHGINPHAESRSASIYTMHKTVGGSAKHAVSFDAGVDDDPRIVAAAGARLGDRVSVRYDDGRAATFMLSSAADARPPDSVSIESPLGQSLSGAEVDDEVEFQIDGSLRKVVILRVERKPRAVAA